MNVRLDECHRKEAFVLLVGLQDEGLSVEESRKKVAKHYDIRVSQVLGIEQEGIEKAWPPLEDCS